MAHMHEEILGGLSQIPVPPNPGRLIVTGHSQAIFTGNILFLLR